MSEPRKLTAEAFARLYESNPDPWNFATSDYEREKYAATLDALPPGRFRGAFEVGCSIGVLTRMLAERCDSVLAVDVADRALDQGRDRCSDLAWVSFANMVVPQDWPEGTFDLILFSEVLYYLGIPGIEAAARRTMDSLALVGSVVLVNWHGPTDGACSGDDAAELFMRSCHPRLRPVLQRRAEKYRIDVLR